MIDLERPGVEGAQALPDHLRNPERNPCRGTTFWSVKQAHMPVGHTKEGKSMHVKCVIRKPFGRAENREERSVSARSSKKSQTSEGVDRMADPSIIMR